MFADVLTPLAFKPLRGRDLVWFSVAFANVSLAFFIMAEWLR